MRIHNYYKEKPGLKHGDVYLKVALLGIFLGFVLIGGMKLLNFLIKLIIKYWIWTIVLIAVAFLVRHFLRKRRRRI